jgi:hypothetical protein
MTRTMAGPRGRDARAPLAVGVVHTHGRAAGEGSRPPGVPCRGSPRSRAAPGRRRSAAAGPAPLANAEARAVPSRGEAAARRLRAEGLRSAVGLGVAAMGP